MKHTPNSREIVYAFLMGRTNIEIDENLVRKARKLTRLKTKREIVDAALELLVRSESRKGILRHFGTGIWKGDLKAMRRNDFLSSAPGRAGAELRRMINDAEPFALAGVVVTRILQGLTRHASHIEHRPSRAELLEPRSFPDYREAP